jgi:hypothetical protein
MYHHFDHSPSVDFTAGQKRAWLCSFIHKCGISSRELEFFEENCGPQNNEVFHGVNIEIDKVIFPRNLA